MSHILLINPSIKAVELLTIKPMTDQIKMTPPSFQMIALGSQFLIGFIRIQGRKSQLKTTVFDKPVENRKK